MTPQEIELEDLRYRLRHLHIRLAALEDKQAELEGQIAELQEDRHVSGAAQQRLKQHRLGTVRGVEAVTTRDEVRRMMTRTKQQDNNQDAPADLPKRRWIWTGRRYEDVVWTLAELDEWEVRYAEACSAVVLDRHTQRKLDECIERLDDVQCD